MNGLAEIQAQNTLAAVRGQFLTYDKKLRALRLRGADLGIRFMNRRQAALWCVSNRAILRPV